MKVLLRVKEVKGECLLGHREGDRWIIDSVLTPGGLCMHAFYVLYPWIQVLRMEGKVPWEKNGEVEIPCIDRDNPVIFSLRRIDNEECS